MDCCIGGWDFRVHHSINNVRYSMFTHSLDFHLLIPYNNIILKRKMARVATSVAITQRRF
jgi:hypothetical protein